MKGITGPNFGADASPSLFSFLRDVTREVTDPNTQMSVYDAWKASSMHDDDWQTQL